MNGTSQPIPPPPGAPPQTPPKKGLSPLAWVLIGCGGLIVLAMLVMGGLVAAGGWFVKKQADKFEKNPTLAAAELVVRLNPDLELVSKDEEHSTLTIKNKKTGEVATFSAEDAKNGKFVFKTKDGTTVFDASGKEGTIKVTNDKGEVATFGAGTPQNLPSWLPSYPGGTVQGMSDTTNAEGRTAAFNVTTPDPADKVIEYYETQFKNAGLKVDKTTMSSNDQTAGGTLTAKSDDDKRQATVIISASGQGTQATITFQEKK
jgi:hypothetical protein